MEDEITIKNQRIFENVQKICTLREEISKLLEENKIEIMKIFSNIKVCSLDSFILNNEYKLSLVVIEYDEDKHPIDAIIVSAKIEALRG